jgi:hypothetical protein
MRLPSAIPRFLCLALVLLTSWAAAQAPIANEKVALSGERDPFGGLFQPDLRIFRLGDDGALLFTSQFFRTDGLQTTRLYSGTYAGATRRITDGARATGNRAVSDFLLTAANDSGQIAVMGYVGSARNIYLLTGTTLKTLVEEQADAVGNGQFAYLYDPAMDTWGLLAFKADIERPEQPDELPTGIFVVDGTKTPPTLQKVAVVGNAVPGSGTFTDFDYRLSIATRPDNKVVVFFSAATIDADVPSAGLYAAVVGGAGPAAVTPRIAEGLHPELAANRVGQVVFRDSDKLYLAGLESGDTGPTIIAQMDDAAPGGGLFSTFGEAAINDAGTVVFQAWTDTGVEGLYLLNAGVITQLAAQGQVRSGETLNAFGTPQINQNGLIAFRAEAMRNNNWSYSIYLSDGTTLLRVTGSNEALAGSTVQPYEIERALVLEPQSLNIHGQIAFSAKLANEKEGVFIATPTSHLRSGGGWDDPLTWDFRIVPGSETPVLADSAADATVQLAGARKVRSLAVGGGTGTTTLDLAGSTLTAPKGVSLLDHGALSGSGTIAANLTMAAGSSLNLDLAGLTRTAYDFLRVTGTATLGGTLAVTKSGGFEPTRGQTFDLLDLTRRVGIFATVSLPPLDPAGQTWDAARLYTTGAITVSGATLFAPTAGVYTGTLEGNPTAVTTSGWLQLTLSPNGTLRGSIYYAGRRYLINTVLKVDGSATISFGLPKKTLQVQLATVNQAPQFTATVSTNATPEAQSTAARTNPAFPKTSPLVGHYTIALPPDPAHPEATFPQGTGYAKVTVTTRGLATLVGVLGDGTPFSVGGPVTAAGEFPFYIPAYGLKGVVAGKLVLHSATPADSVEGSFRWLKPAVTTGKFKSAIDATITVFGSGFQNPVAPAKILAFTNDQATFHATGGNVDPLTDKTVVFSTAYQLKSATAEPFVFTFSAGTFGLGSGNFRDSANKVRTMKGVALQKQNEVVGLLIGTDQTGTFDID